MATFTVRNIEFELQLSFSSETNHNMIKGVTTMYVITFTDGLCDILRQKYVVLLISLSHFGETKHTMINGVTTIHVVTFADGL